MRLATILALLPCAALAQDPIDGEMQRCLDGASSTMEMRTCVMAAADAWDGALNDAYRAAMGERDAAGKAALREAQRAWLAYRDGDAAFRGQDFQFGVDGTIKQLELDEAGLSVVRARAMLLRGYISR